MVDERSETEPHGGGRGLSEAVANAEGRGDRRTALAKPAVGWVDETGQRCEKRFSDRINQHSGKQAIIRQWAMTSNGKGPSDNADKQRERIELHWPRGTRR